MCGIVGFLSPDGIPDRPSALRVLIAMRDQLIHRGPDGSGFWLDASQGVALGARRLSILDLSEAGDQPLRSADGRYVVVLNGEIYNFPELRAEIETIRRGHPWRGHCDTEVLAEAIALWGVEAAISRTNGMFALAVWDRRERELWLARDRIGKKPLYYGWAGNSFVFASELKALWQHPDFDAPVSVEALAVFLQLGYVLGEQAFFAGVKRLPAGHLLRVDRRALRGDIPSPTPYWRLRDVALAGIEAQECGRIPDEEELASLLDDAVARRMVADVPVGSLLSGGIDSSLVTALMRARGQEVRTFTIGFAAAGWNEAQHASTVAKHLGTRHEELYVSAAEFINVLREVPHICDEPFADNSMIPTILLSRMARQSVTVALSGDGGDELFVGYDRYAAVDRLLARCAKIPVAIRSLVRNLNDVLSRPAAVRWGSTKLERRLTLLSHLLRNGDATGFPQLILSQQLNVSSLLDVPCGDLQPLSDLAFNLDRSTAIDRMTFMDTMSFLVDDILFKMDRASMSASLEVRCPLLDHRVIELSWRFPIATKCSGTVGKLPLRKILYRHVPRPIVDRPKMGFSAPIEIWLKAELRDWAEALMTREMLAGTGLLNVGACRKLWEDFACRGRGWNPALWNILMFQAWHQEMRSMSRVGASLDSLDRYKALRYSSARETAPHSSVPHRAPADSQVSL
jgi:asparagine synthase (glutamine-hydrolysing)